MKVAVVLFNLGGPDGPDAVEPFLRNLFSDPAIISLPAILRLPLAYAGFSGSPIGFVVWLGSFAMIIGVSALEFALDGMEAKAFIAMRCWHPFSDGAAQAIKNFAPDHIVLLPLYPQYSTTTSASSLSTSAFTMAGTTVRSSP